MSNIVVPLSATLTDEEIIRLMDEKPVEGYDIDPVENGLPPSSSGFIILNYDDEVIDGMWRILNNPKQQKYWKSALIDFRRVATAEPDRIDLSKLVQNTENIEQSDTIEEDDKVRLLFFAYDAIARHRNDRAFGFLKDRTKFEFWEGNEISRTVYTSHGAGSEGILETAQSMAIKAIAELQTEEAFALLQSLFSDERYSSKPHLNIPLSGILEYGGWEASAGRLKTIQAEYAKRLELRGEAASPQAIEEPSVESSGNPSASEVEEVAQGSTAPEPATEKAAEMKTPDASEEATDQSSNGWLWLIGAVVVFGGIGLITRRKS